MKKLDKKDYDILRIMVMYGTTNSEKIASLTNISSKTIRNRIFKYKQNNIFKTAILINPKYFNFTIKADFFIKLFKDIKIEVFIKTFLKKYKHNLLYLGHHWDKDEDISIQTIFQTTKEIVKFKREIESNNMIERFKMIIVPVVNIDTYQWMPHQNNFKLTQKDIANLEARRKKEKDNFNWWENEKTFF